MRIAVVGDRHEAERLTGFISDFMATQDNPADIDPRDIYLCRETPLPQGTAAAFVAVNSMQAVEVARQIAYWRPDLPLVIVSQSPEFGVEGFRLRAAHYLLEPPSHGEIAEALSRCVLREGDAV